MVTPLPYTLHTRYRSIALAWILILLPPSVLNIGLFYGLWYGCPHLDRVLGNMNHVHPVPKTQWGLTAIVLTLPTTILGIFTALATIERLWKLVQTSPEYRPLKAPRYGLDVFQWGYLAAVGLISALVSAALARGDGDGDEHEFQMRLLSLPVSLLMFFLATLTLVSLILNAFEIRLPFRFGSLDAREVVRPAVYYIVEDVVAVDGGGGREYREAWMARYAGSGVFREMIWMLSLWWMGGLYLLALVGGVFVFRGPKVAVYAVGWAGPFPLVGLMAAGTIFYVRAMLVREANGEEGNRRIEIIDSAVDSAEDERTPLLE